MKNVILNIIKYSASFAAALILIEIFFRLSEIFLPSIVYDDPKLGLLRKPNAQIFSLNEGFGMGSVNEFGYLGPAYSKEKDKNTLRIALIGASMVQGLELFDRHHFRKLLQDKLKAYTGKNVEVLNFGRGGIDFRGIYTTYKYIASDYSPDICLIFTGIGQLVSKDDKPGPEYSIQGDTLQIDYSFAESSQFKQRTKYKFLRLTAIGNLLKRGYEFYQLGSPSQFILGSLYKQPVVYINNNGIEDKSKKDVFYDLNRIIINEFSKANRDNIKNIIIKSDKYPVYYDSLINKTDLKVIDLDKVLISKKDAGENIDFWKGSNTQGHWTHYGHEVVAEYLFEQLKPFIRKQETFF